MSARWTEQQLAEHLSSHPRALRRNPLGSSLISVGKPNGFAAEEKRPAVVRPKHDYKAEFVQQLEFAGVEIEPEFMFARPRKYRADWRIKNTRILLEFEGGLFTGGQRGHNSIKGVLKDVEKYNLAALLGWTVIRITPKHVVSGQALLWVEEALVYC